MAAIPTEILIRTFLEAAMHDLRENDWIVEDIFCGLATDPISKLIYGWKVVEEAVEWFKNNHIEVYESYRIGDSPTFPSITIEKAVSGEELKRTNLGDQNIITKSPPQDIKKQIRKIIQNFSPASYDPDSGLLKLPKKFDTKNVAAGMFLVSAKTSNAYQITQVPDGQHVQIKSGIFDADFTEAYIAPRSQMYNIHKEVTYLNERFNIGIHTQSRLVTNIWLSQIIQYIFMRYKEAYLEARGFELSTFQMGPIELNELFKPEDVFTRYCSLTGDVPFDFIKFAAPQLDNVKAGIKIIDGPKTPEGFRDPVDKEGWVMEADELDDITEDDLPTLGGADEDGSIDNE